MTDRLVRATAAGAAIVAVTTTQKPAAGTVCPI